MMDVHKATKGNNGQLKSLQIGKASGGDFISHQMLKNTADTVYLRLKYIFNHSLRISKYPSIQLTDGM
jgi:hypothetical protein